MKNSKFLVLSVFLLFLITACKVEEVEQEEKVVKIGSTVVFDYASGFYNGTLFDTSFENIAREAGIYDPDRLYGPETAVVGQDPLLPALVEAMLGMKEGEVKNIRLSPERAYGAKIENSTSILSKRAFDDPENLKIDEMVVIATPEGDRIPVFVTSIGKNNITIDQNHPLAGEHIQFAVIVRKIE